MSKIKFGTDGWRAIISEDFTFENVKIVGQAIADFIKSRKEPVYKKKKVAIGYDTRFLSDKYAELIACVLAANGIKAILSEDVATTPSVCVYIKEKKLTGGVMITASHNPYSYNGIKYKGYFGGSAGSDIIDDIESRLHKSKVKFMPLEDAMKKKMVTLADMVKVQMSWVKDFADMTLLNKSKLKVIIDSMNGTGERHIGDLLKRSKIKLDYLYAERNPGFNGRAPEPNAKNLKELTGKVKKGKYNLGIATDGDSDRLAIVDEKGHVLTGHTLMALLLLHLMKNRKMRGAVVQTICGTGLIDRICEKNGLKMYETPVGFKYICDIMCKKDILVGGEETGGIGIKNYVPERDGFLSALLIMELIAVEKKPLSKIVADMHKEYGKYVYRRGDYVFNEAKRKQLISGMKKKPLKSIDGKSVVEVKDYDGVKFICENGNWLLIRLSGTEPKLRIYAETGSEKKSLEYVEIGRKYAFSLMK